ncbi:MAG: response regulator [Polyangiaceae bacterium]
MGLEAKNAAWDVERELDREEKATAPSGTNNARAEFLANLGRRAGELSSMLASLEREPASARLRDDLRRRLHALGIGARLLRFDRLSAEIVSAEDVLAEVAERAELNAANATALKASFAKLASLGFTPNDLDGEGEAPGLVPVQSATSPAAPPRSWPMSVLVVGPKAIADAILQPAAEGAPSIDVERTEDALRAIDLARAVAPDVIVVDADQRGARELVSSLHADPLTAGAAIVALGTWSRAEDASGFLSAGAARAVHKPVSPDALRRVCRDAAADPGKDEARQPLGAVSIAELSARLAREVERAISAGVDAPAGDARVDLGRGDEVLDAVLAAAARVRDVVTIKSRGEIRFAPGAAERAVPVGGWMNDPAPAPDAKGPRRNGARGGSSLAGARVLVADDDPAVAWFLAGVLRAEGAQVSEACDGAAALRKAMEQTPDLVLADVLMPNLDGLSLTETLRADPLTSDAAIVLLSWKDDLLQRARELGSRADAYLRKDASGPIVVERSRELLYPRARLSERIAAGGEVHGRVDGLTMCTLLKLVCTHRPQSRVEVRDAAYLYEIEIEDGAPVSATQVARDGKFVRGEDAMARLLGVRAGRFVVSAKIAGADPVPRTLTGTLIEQVRPHAAASRGALRLLSGPGLTSVSRLTLDETWLAEIGALAPEPVRALIRKLYAGDPPRKILGTSIAAARLLDEVLHDAALRGAVTRVLGAQGEDLLPAAIEAELATLRGERPKSPQQAATSSEAGASIAVVSASPESDSDSVQILIDEVSPSGVMMAPAMMASAPVAPAPMLLASAAADSIAAHGTDLTTPPDASIDAIDATGGPGTSAPRPSPPLLTLGSLTPPPAAPRIEPEPPADAPVIRLARKPAPAIVEEDESPPPRRSKRKERAETPAAPAVTKSSPRIGVWVMCAVAGIVFAVGARISQDRKGPPAVAAAPAVVVPATASAEPTTSAPKPSSAPALSKVTVPGETIDDPILPQEAPLRADEKVPSGQGILEVIAGPSDEISIDGQPTVAGPVVKATLAPRAQPYEIKVKLKSEERTRYATIKEGKRTRVRIAPPWNH